MHSKRLLRFIIVLGIIVVLIFIIYINWQRISNFAIKRSLTLLQKNIGAKITYQSLSGNIFQNPNFSGIQMIFSSGDSILAKRVSINYDPIALLRGKFIFRNIQLLEPKIFWYSKKIQPVKEESKAVDTIIGELPNLSLPRLVIKDGEIFFNSELRAHDIQTTLSLISVHNEVKANLQKLSFVLTKEKVNLNEMKGIFSFDGKELGCDTIWLRTDRSQASLKGKFNLLKTAHEIQIRSSTIDMKEFFKEQGKVTLRGKIKIDDKGLNGKVNLSANDIMIKDMTLPDLNTEVSFVNNLAKYKLSTTEQSAETINLVGELNLNKLTYQGECRFQNLFPSNYIEKIPEFAMSGEVKFTGTRQDTVEIQLYSNLSQLPIDSVYLNSKFEKGRLTINHLRIWQEAHALDLIGNITKDWINLDYKLNGFPTELIGKFLNIEVLGGITGTGKVTGSFNSLSVSTEIGLTQGKIEQVNFHKLNLSFDIANIKPTSFKINQIFQYDANNIVLLADSLALGNNMIGNVKFTVKDTGFILSINNRKAFNLLSNGGIALRKNNFYCQFDSLIIISGNETLAAKEPFQIKQVNDTFSFTGPQFYFAGGDLSFNLRVKDIFKPDIRLETKGIDLAKFQRFLRKEERIKGNADVSLRTNQNYDLKFFVNDFIVNNSDLNLKLLEGSLTLTENEIQIEKLRLIRNEQASEIYGSVDYSLNKKPMKFEFGDFSLHADIYDPGVWILSFLKDIIRVETGTFYGSVDAKGSIKEADFKGRVRINNARLFIVATKTTVEKANGELLFDRNRIILSKISGQVDKGSITGSGWTELENLTKVKALQYDINGRDLPINPQKDIYGIVSGNFQIAWQENGPTSLKGDIAVKDALLTIGFGQEVKAGSNSESNLTYNITVKGERGIWLRNSYADIELSIDLNLRKTLTETFYSGNLMTRQGNIYYLDHNLNLTEGSIKFDNINELNPDLNLNAEMYTRSMRVNSDNPERVKIKLNLTGTLKQPVFNFYSEPAILSQDDIISYLTLNVTPQEISAAEQREIFNKLVSERFLGYFEREIAKKLRSYIRLDYLQFESGLFEGGKTAKVTVGKYIADNLYATYTHNVTGAIQDLFKVEYYITKSHEVIGERDEQGRYRLKYQFKFRY
jgi:hypothetical protein